MFNQISRAVIPLLSILTIIMVNTVAANHMSAAGLPDDSNGVWLFSAGTATDDDRCGAGTPGGTAVDDAVMLGVALDLVELYGDRPEEILRNDGLTADGLSAIDAFGDLNVRSGNTTLALEENGQLHVMLYPSGTVVQADGVISDGSIDLTAAEDGLPIFNGTEILIIEDGELDGMTIELNSPFNTYQIVIADRQINPNTANGSDDTLIAIDLDSLDDWDNTYITDIRLIDDGEVVPASECGTPETDAIAIDGIMVYKQPPIRHD